MGEISAELTRRFELMWLPDGTTEAGPHQLLRVFPAPRPSQSCPPVRRKCLALRSSFKLRRRCSEGPSIFGTPCLAVLKGPRNSLPPSQRRRYSMSFRGNSPTSALGQTQFRSGHRNPRVKKTSLVNTRTFWTRSSLISSCMRFHGSFTKLHPWLAVSSQSGGARL